MTAREVARRLDSSKDRKGLGTVSRREVADEMTFRVVFTKEGKDWIVVAPDIQSAHSWGPNLKSATEHIKEAIALVLDLPDGAEERMVLDAEYRVDGEETSEPSVFRRARDTRWALKQAQQEADETLREAIQEGRRHGISMRDIATMSDVSYQRVAQIASES